MENSDGKKSYVLVFKTITLKILYTGYLTD